MKKILVTGFDPFGGEAINPATESVKQLPDEILGVQILKREIPTVFDRSIEVLYGILKEEQPDVVICVGQAGGRPNITVERIAINQDDARIPDNDGKLLGVVEKPTIDHYLRGKVLELHKQIASLV